MHTQLTVLTAQAAAGERAAEAALVAERRRRLREDGAPVEAPGLLTRIARRLLRKHRVALTS